MKNAYIKENEKNKKNENTLAPYGACGRKEDLLNYKKNN